MQNHHGTVQVLYRNITLNAMKWFYYCNTANKYQSKVKVLKNGWAALETGQMSANTKKKDRRWKEQFIQGINDNRMTKIIRKLTTVKKRSEITSEKVWAWAQRVEVQSAQKDIIPVSVAYNLPQYYSKIGNNIYHNSRHTICLHPQWS